MKSLVLIFTFITILSVACSTTKKGMSETDAYTEFQNDLKDDTLFASIERGFCFGTCPVYKLYIYTNGNAIYEGIKNVNMNGVFAAQLSPEQMNRLITSAKSIGYMEFENEYDDPNVTDKPTTTTSIVIDGKRKQVKRRHRFPSEIIGFEKTFDEIVTEVEWKKTK